MLSSTLILKYLIDNMADLTENIEDEEASLRDSFNQINELMERISRRMENGSVEGQNEDEDRYTTSSTSSDEEWKPKSKRSGIDLTGVTEIRTAEKPLYDICDIPQVTDSEEEENGRNHRTDSPVTKNGKIPSVPSKTVNNHAQSTGAVKKPSTTEKSRNFSKTSNEKPTLPKSALHKPLIDVAGNKDAGRIIKKLVEYFTFHNSLSEREKHKHKHILSRDLTNVFSEVFTECANNIYQELQSEYVPKKVKTKNVACQTIVTGDVLSVGLISANGENTVQLKNTNHNRSVDLEEIINKLNGL